ncbi:hypothetical protein CHS0354_017521 [Potamilus streckersoni]|uniref:WW domain-containing protein n=1 Tax=Potamilus streckersoni TaxID=2493646 RepID=A0AAE0VQD5_9BIVA|nr:hypothetical protein CHS0354_017521 [Potamilus streckersoni]
MSSSQKENLNKPTLPHGWIVRQSKTYPDRVYYFNVDTGVSTWEIPKLIKDKVTGSAPRMTLPGQTSHLQKNQLEAQIEEAQFSPEPDTESEEAEETEIRGFRWDISSPSSSSKSDMTFFFQSKSSHFQVQKNLTSSFDSVKSPLKLSTSATQIITSPSVDVKIASAGSPHDQSKGNVRSVMNDKIKRQVTCTDNIYGSFQIVTKRMRENVSYDMGRRVQISPPHKKSKEDLNKDTKLLNQPIGKDFHISKSGTKRKSDSNSQVSDPCLDKRTVLSYDNEHANSKHKRTESVPSISDSKSVRRKSSSFSIDGEELKLDSAVDGDRRKVRVVSKSKDQNNIPNDSDNSSAGKNQISSRKSEPVLKNATLKDEAPSLKVKVSHKTPVSSHSSLSSTDRLLVTTSPVVSENSKERNVVIFPPLGDHTCFRDEKLKIIQSWIDSLQSEPASSPSHSVETQPGVSAASPTILPTHGAGKSETPFLLVESNDRRVVVAHDETKSGGKKYLQQQIDGRRGWPGKVVPGPKKMVERQISEMEVDDIPLPETLLEASAQEEDMIVDVVLSEVREQLRNHPEQVVGSLTKSLYSGGATFCQTADEMHTTSLYIVIDTNVFMDHLSFISDLKDQALEGFGRPILIIPWIVLQELDALKGDGGNCRKGIPNLSLQTQRKARKPVQFLNNVFQAKHPCIVGQTPKESSEAAQVFKAECNDDRILQCCMQCQRKYINSEVVLLTNDKNLINKAFACKIPAFSKQLFHDGIKKLFRENTHSKAPLERAIAPLKSPPNLPQPQLIVQTASPNMDFQHHQQQQQKQDSPVKLKGLVDEIFCLLKTQMKSALGHVLEMEMKEAFGDDMWLTIVLKKPPWSLLDILECFRKHWRAVFGFVFDRKLEDVVHKIVRRFSIEKGCVQSMEILEELLLEVLLLLEGCQQHSSYNGLVTEAVTKLRILQKLCSDVLDNNANISTLPSLDVYLQQKMCLSQSSQASTPLLTPGSIHQQVNINQHSEIRVDHQAVTPSSKPDNQMMSYPISVATASVTIQGSSEIAIKKFHQIWEAIHHCCAVLDKFYMDWITNPNMDPEESKEAFLLLSNLVPAVRDLHREFSVISSLPPAAIYQHPQAVSSMCTHLNTFFSRMQAEDPEEHVAEIHLATLFSEEDKRPILQSGMEQLDSFIRQIYLYVKALPDT